MSALCKYHGHKTSTVSQKRGKSPLGQTQKQLGQARPSQSWHRNKGSPCHQRRRSWERSALLGTTQWTQISWIRATGLSLVPLLRSFKEIALPRRRRPKAAGSNQSPVSPQHLGLGQRFHRRRLLPASSPPQVPRCRYGKGAPCPGHKAPAPALQGSAPDLLSGGCGKGTDPELPTAAGHGSKTTGAVLQVFSS